MWLACLVSVLKAFAPWERGLFVGLLQYKDMGRRPKLN